MKAAAICCTYKRAPELAEAIESFLRQDFPADKRELIILDDAGQYAPTALDGIPGVKLITTGHRFATLGEKRNASAALAGPDCEVLFPWDDDDIYLPWHMSATIASFADSQADYTIPTKLWMDKGNRLQPKDNQYLFHGAWAFRRSSFAAVNGYPWIQSGQDQGLLKRFKAAAMKRADPIQCDPRPSYVYRWYSTHKHHISAMGKDGYEKFGKVEVKLVEKLIPKWSKDWEKLAK